MRRLLAASCLRACCVVCVKCPTHILLIYERNYNYAHTAVTHIQHIYLYICIRCTLYRVQHTTTTHTPTHTQIERRRRTSRVRVQGAATTIARDSVSPLCAYMVLLLLLSAFRQAAILPMPTFIWAFCCCSPDSSTPRLVL